MLLVRNAYAVSLILTALAVLVLAAAAWARRRAARGAAALSLLAVIAVLWVGSEALWLIVGAGGGSGRWLEAHRAAGALLAAALLGYALRATRMPRRGGPALLWAAAALSVVAAALAFGPVGGLSLYRSLRPAAVMGHTVTVGVASGWSLAATAVVAIIVAASVLLLARAWLRAQGTAAAGYGWTLLGVALPVAAEALAAGLRAGSWAPGSGAPDPAFGALSPGALLLAPAALAAAQGLLGGSRALSQAAAAEPVEPAAGTAPRELLDHLDQPVLLISPADAVSYANAAAARVFRPTGGLPGARAAVLFGDVPELAGALARRRRAVLDVSVRRGTTLQPFEASLTPLFAATGRFAGTLVTLRDVTDRRRAESQVEAGAAELQRSEALMTALQDALRGALRGEPRAMQLDIVLTGVAAALELPHAAVYLRDEAADALVRVVAVGGFESQVEPPRRRQEGLAGQVWESGRLLTAAELPLPAVRGITPEPWAGAAAGAPVRDRGRVVGALLVACRHGDTRAFGAAELRVLERFADLAAIAVRDAAAQARAARAELELAWSDRIDALRREDAADTEVLDAVLRAAREVAGFDRVVVWLAVEGGRALEAQAWLGFPQGPEGGERWPLNGAAPLLEEAFRSGREIVLPQGAPLPERFRPAGAAADAPLLRANRPVVLPLIGGDGVLGVLAADDSQEGVALEPRLRALRRVAARAAQALERGRLRGEAGCLQRRAAEAHARLEAAGEQREALIAALPAAYFEIDLNGVVTRPSAELARLAGGSEDGLRGVRLADLAASGADEALSQLVGRVLRSGRVARGVPWALRRDGGALAVEMSLGVLRDEEGGARGFFGTLSPRQS